ncbi:sulfotransferase domain-containing protein [Argonema galeatum]|uniref:sulfotransferase domain-containing protein n=1 Tax=Argonema galeatum TaxID=2942762 RepID=UPI002012650D|nr:sulfotransferase domain-containing protein [Argonema galeatum]MCL1468746.1 sulfotransferase domain-containing protein [Argonema galeatum A003/A1]
MQEINQGYKTEEIKFLHFRMDGLILFPYMSEQRVKDLTKFATKPGDVFIVTYPKSGTVWMTQIIKEIFNPVMPEGLEEEDIIGGRVPFLEEANLAQLDRYQYPRYIYSHLSYSLIPYNSEQELKYIFIARNPRDVAVSYFHFMRALKELDWDGTWEEYFQYFLKGTVPYGSYFDHILEWWENKDQRNLLFIKYEDMKKDLESHVKKVANFLGENLSSQEVKRVSEACNFSNMKADPRTNNDRYHDKIYKQESKFSFMRKGVVGDWQNYFSEEQLEEFNKLYTSRMVSTGLDFEFIA